MRCASCGAESGEHDSFCEDCGAPLGLICTTCGKAIAAGKRFCGQCGTPVPPAVEIASPSDASPSSVEVVTPVVAERRMCSVLFCDLVGFTTLSENRDPEAVRELLGRYFELARTVITRYGGAVEKFIGDAVMAVWGTPVADEHDAERAVRAALELVEAIASLGTEIGAGGLAARAGVVSGVVAVNLGADGQGMVAGDAVNTAARIQAVAQPGGVLVDDATRRAVGEAVAFGPASEFSLKGKDNLVSVWSADRVLAGVGGSQRVDGLEAPLVGGNAELRLVKELFHACAERRTPRLVSVVGAAGVGKSRLGWEFEKYVDGLADTVRWHRGRCLSYGDGVAFFALAEMVRQRFAIAEEDPPAVAGAKLRDGLPQWIDDPTEFDYIGQRLGQLLGVDSDAPTLGREELFAGWRLFFERLAARTPVVLMIEDLQHGDPGLFDFLEHLLDWARDAPIFVLTLSRPELESRRPGWGAGRGNTAVNLDPLVAPAMGELLDGLVPGMPEKAKSAIAERAEGIPLYAVETVRMLIDRDVVQPIDGVYRLVGNLGELTVPTTLHSLLAARLDAFDPDVRRLIADASVLGGSFPREALIAVSGIEDSRVDRLLADLVRREVLAVRADPLSPERGQYAFVQTMFRQVAYDTQSRHDRKARHLAVAAHLQETFADGGEEIAEVISAHLVDALTAVPDAADVPDLRDRAVTMLTLAGERGERTGASAAAATSYAAAARLLEEAGDEHLLDAGAMWERAGLFNIRADNDAALEQLDRARAIFLTAGRVRDVARVDHEAGRALSRLGRYEEARVRAIDSYTALRDSLDAESVASEAELASLEVFAGNPEGDRLVLEALDRAQRLDLPDGSYCVLLQARAATHLFNHRLVEATAYLREALARAEAAGDNAMTGLTLANLSDVLMTTDVSASIDLARAAVAHCRRVGDRVRLAYSMENLLQGLLLVGAWDEIETVLAAAAEDGLDGDLSAMQVGLMLRALRGDATVADDLMSRFGTWASRDDPQDKALWATLLTAAAAARADHESALREARTALSQSEAFGLRTDAVRWCWPIAADSALALGRLEALAELTAEVDRHPPGHQPPLLRAERARIEARLLAANGDGEAPAAFEVAVRKLRDLHSPYHLALGLLDHAEFLANEGDAEAAEVLATEARSIAERLRAQPLLDRALRLAPVLDAPEPASASAAESLSVPAT